MSEQKWKAAEVVTGTQSVDGVTPVDVIRRIPRSSVHAGRFGKWTKHVACRVWRRRFYSVHLLSIHLGHNQSILGD